jgi:hypothetical protein
MGTLHDVSANRKNQSLTPSRALILMLTWIEREWQRRPKTPTEEAYFREAHRGLAGLLELQENGVVTP